MTEWLGMGLIGVMAIAIVLTAGLVVVRLKGYRSTRSDSPALEPPSYEPLARLMSTQDAEFLRRQPCGVELEADWDRARRRVIRLFLNEIVAEFRTLHGQARGLVAEAPEQYADLAQTLMSQQFAFWRIMAGIEIRLLLGRFRIGANEGRALTEMLDAIRAEIAHATTSAPIQA